MVVRKRRWMMALGFAGTAGAACDEGTAQRGTPVDPPGVVAPPVDPVVTLPVGPVTPPVTPPDPPVVLPPASTDPVARIDQNLATLRAMELVDVGELVVDSPRAGGHCYGFPCDDAETAAIRAEKAAALDQLVALAEEIPAGSAAASGACDLAAAMDSVDGNIETLHSLAIVDVGRFLVTEPANNPMCYNLPCGEDIARAAEADCAKAARLGAWAKAAAEAFDGEVTVTPTVDEAAAIAAVDANLNRLRALDLFDVGDLVFGADVERSSCYVCNPTPQWRRVAATRLEALVNLAEAAGACFASAEASGFAEDPACAPASVEANLETLRELQIVDVGGLIERDPAGEGLCYVGFCSEADEAEAHARACKRAVVIQGIVQSGATGL